MDRGTAQVCSPVYGEREQSASEGGRSVCALEEPGGQSWAVRHRECLQERSGPESVCLCGQRTPRTCSENLDRRHSLKDCRLHILAKG